MKDIILQVQLKVASALLAMVAIPVFQFHTGSIKRYHYRKINFLGSSFNSILVQLKVSTLKTTIRAKSCFNSILVQLKEIGGGFYPLLNF